MRLNVYVLAYRDWAAPVVRAIMNHPRIDRIAHFSTNDQYERSLRRALAGDFKGDGTFLPDLVIYCGWSDEPVKDLIKKVPHVGVHCATSDVYSGGTPIQNQIIDGVKRTKHRVFRVGHPELSERLWSHEVDLDLSGSMSDVLSQMTSTSISLYNSFLDDWPDIDWKLWPAVDPSQMRPRRTLAQSVLTKNELVEMSTVELYDFFRCLEDPYPNGCIEDEHGTLYIEKVRFKSR